jgi:predicted dehydrogenase
MLNLGILSTAKINRNAILLPVGKREDVTIKAVASRDQKRAEAFAREFRVPHAYEGYERLLEDKSIDAVYISTPNALHVPWVEKALMCGKHVLCEKPLSPTQEDALRLAKLAEKKGLLLMEALHYSYHPFVRGVMEDLREGKLGRIEKVSMKLGFSLPPDGDIRYQPKLMGGAFMHMGCYCIHFIQHIIDLPLNVRSISAERIDGSTADVFCKGAFKVSGHEGEFSFKVSLKDKELNSHIEIEGEKGRLTISDPFNPVLARGNDYIDVVRVKSDNSFFASKKQPEFGRTTYDFQLEEFLNALAKDDLAPRMDLRNSAVIEQGRQLLSAA